MTGGNIVAPLEMTMGVVHHVRGGTRGQEVGGGHWGQVGRGRCRWDHVACVERGGDWCQRLQLVSIGLTVVLDRHRHLLVLSEWSHALDRRSGTDVTAAQIRAGWRVVGWLSQLGGPHVERERRLGCADYLSVGNRGRD